MECLAAWLHLKYKLLSQSAMDQRKCKRPSCKCQISNKKKGSLDFGIKKET